MRRESLGAGMTEYRKRLPSLQVAPGSIPDRAWIFSPYSTFA